MVAAGGFAGQRLRDLAQTKDGYLWLAMQMGLVRFDGIRFESINVPDIPAFRRGAITHLAAAANGGLWFGIEGGAFGSYDGTEFHPMTQHSWVEPAMGISALLESQDGWLWVGGGGGTGRCRGETTNGGAFFPQLNRVTALFEDPHHRIWLGTPELGLFYWQAGSITPFPDAALRKKAIFAVAVDLHDQLWVGTQAGVHCYDSNFVRHDLVQTATDVKALLVDRHGVVWIGTAGDGLICYRNGESRYFKRADGLANDSVTSLLEDQEGSLWVGTKDGLSQLSDVKFPIFTSAEGLVGGSCHGLCVSTNGAMWTATTKGLTWFDGQTFARFSQNIGLTNAYVKQVYEARNGEVYFINANRTGDREVGLLDGGRMVVPFSTSNSWPIAFAEDDQSVVVAVSGDLFRVSRTQSVPYAFRDGKAPAMLWIRNLFGCADGSLLVATVDGVFKIKNGAYVHWSTGEGLSDSDVFWASEDRDGAIWAGLTTGLARIKAGQVRNIRQKDGLSDSVIRAVVPDDLGNLWMQSSRGFLRASLRSLNDFADGKTNWVECALYEGLESVKSIETADVECSGCKTPDGRIWFPTPSGPVMIDPAHIIVNTVPPPVHIEHVLVNGVEQTGLSPAAVRPGRGELVVQFTGLSYIEPQKVRFRYRLEGYDSSWIDGGNRRSVFYANLKPQSYTFAVQACNADGVWSKTPAEFTVYLPPHFYQTLWFDAAAALAGTAILLGGYGWRIRYLARKQQHLQQANESLEREIAKRTSELAEQRNLLRALIDNLPDSVFVKDLQSRVVVDNIAHARMLGLADPAEAVGKTDADCLPAEQARKFLAAEHDLLQRGTEYDAEETIVDARTGDVRWLRTTKVPLRDRDGAIIGLAGIHRDISERKKWEAESESLHQKLLEVSRRAGMADVATSVLHNVGNVLNSANVSASLILSRLRKLNISSLEKTVQLMHEHAGDLGYFVSVDERGRNLLPYLEQLARRLTDEQASLLAEIKVLTDHMEHINGIVVSQQAYAKMGGFSEVVQPVELAEQALRLQRDACERHSIRLVRDFGATPALVVDRHKILQILVNLIQNAQRACESNPPDARGVIVRVGLADGKKVRIEVADNGVGISAETMTQIFSHGFTTRKDGHGFGLHSGALAARELGGSLSAFSQGPGLGATFTLELPVPD